MKHQYALKTAGFIFLIVGLLHLLRFIFKFQVMFGAYHIPLWASGIGFLAALGLSGWMFYCAKT